MTSQSWGEGQGFFDDSSKDWGSKKHDDGRRGGNQRWDNNILKSLLCTKILQKCQILTLKLIFFKYS